MGCDVCYTNYAGQARIKMTWIIHHDTFRCRLLYFCYGAFPGSDDIMLKYQTTSFHDALYARRVLGLKPAPEFDLWLAKNGNLQKQRAIYPQPPISERVP